MRKFLRSIDFWDLLLAASCLAIFLYAAIFVPNFVSGFNLSQAGRERVGKGVADPADGAAHHHPRDRPVDRLACWR